MLQVLWYIICQQSWNSRLIWCIYSSPWYLMVFTLPAWSTSTVLQNYGWVSHGFPFPLIEMVIDGYHVILIFGETQMLHVGFGLLVNRNLVPDCEDHPPHLPRAKPATICACARAWAHRGEACGEAQSVAVLSETWWRSMKIHVTMKYTA